MKKLCLMFAAFIFLQVSMLAQDLVVSYGDYNSEPYSFSKEGKLTGGIIKEITDALAAELGVTPVYKDVPRKRIYTSLESGETMMASITNPEWVEDKTKYNWSIPLFEEKNIFAVSSAKKISIKGFEDLKGKKLGTMLGYYYPGLMEMFDKKEIIREDVLLLEQNFKKLEAGRIDALIDSDILMTYYIKKNKLEQKIIFAEMTASKHMIYFAVSKKSPINIEKINGAFSKLKEKGKIDEIIKKYK